MGTGAADPGPGPAPPGPDFVVGPPVGRGHPGLPVRPDPRPEHRVTATDFAPPRSRSAPTALALGAAVAVAAAAIGWGPGGDGGEGARLAPPQQTARSAAPPGGRALTGPPAAARATPDAIDFVTASGAGRLRLVGHRWSATAAAGMAQLRLDVEITAHAGTVAYDPYQFQLFDADGAVHEVLEVGASAGVLGVGALAVGETVRGEVSFRLPRQEVTVLMGAPGSTTAAALRVAA